MSDISLSVILPNYNHGNYVAEALSAILSQSRPAEQIIVIDDGSTDESVAIIQSIADKNPSILFLRNAQNLGTVEAGGIARKHLTGTCVYFAAADDQLAPEAFEEMLSLLEAYPKAAMCSALACDLDENGNFGEVLDSPIVLNEPGYIDPEAALKLLNTHGHWFMCNTAIYRTDVLYNMGGFETDLKSYTDSFLCAVMARKYGVCFIPRVFGAIRKSENNFSVKMTTDVDEAIGMFTHARMLMETVYAPYFPKEYVIRWDRRWRYAVLLRLSEKNALTDNAFERLFIAANALDAVIVKKSKLRTRFSRQYLFFRMTPFDFISAIYRRLGNLKRGDFSRARQ